MSKASRRIHVSDTTLRDGEQAPGFHLDPAAKLAIARQLALLGVDVIEAGFPASSPREFEAVRRVAQTVGRAAGAPEIGAFARSVPADVDAGWNAIRFARRPRLHLFIATSDLHLKHKLRMTRDQALERAVAAVRRARALAPQVQFSPEDAFRSDRAFLRRFVEAVIGAGVTIVNVTDTVGFATPEEFGGLVRFLKSNVRNARRARFSVHCHNDLGLAVANTLAAVRAGADQVEGTINGIGERAGNAALEEVIMAVRTRPDLYRARVRVRTPELTPTSRLVARHTRHAVPANKAIVGANAFAHASGVHQDGMLKHRGTYEILKPEDVGAVSALPLTARSGRSAVAERFRRLGVRIAASQWDAVLAGFKRVADRGGLVADADLRRIASRCGGG